MTGWTLEFAIDGTWCRSSYSHRRTAGHSFQEVLTQFRQASQTWNNAVYRAHHTETGRIVLLPNR